MESGSPLFPLGDILSGQRFYDDLVINTGCANASDSLDCLRDTPFEQLKAAMDAEPSFFDYSVSYTVGIGIPLMIDQLFQSFAVSWGPRADGKFLTESQQQLVSSGKVANVSVIIGVRSLHILALFIVLKGALDMRRRRHHVLTRFTQHHVCRSNIFARHFSQHL